MTHIHTSPTKQSDHDRSTPPRQCITAGGETMFFIYPNGRIVPDEMLQWSQATTGEASTSELQA